MPRTRLLTYLALAALFVALPAPAHAGGGSTLRAKAKSLPPREVYLELSGVT